MTGRALFLDRDGVINHEIGYLFRSGHVRFVDGIFPLCRTAKSLGYSLVVVTNQAGIGRGLYTEKDFEVLMDWMREVFRSEHAALDGVYHSPYHPVHGIGRYKREHEDRKPGTGMLRRAARDLGLSLADSVLVGDRCGDMVAANSGGLRQAFLLRGTEMEGCEGVYQAVDSLKEVEAWLVGQGQQPDVSAQSR
jgi:D-glycero-D-manno-heptose 1,7-bisphosphate phosphatase